MAKIFKITEGESCSVLHGSVCAFGVFDGVHEGHQDLLECAIREAQKMSAPSIILTFDKDPDELFHPERLKKLMSNDDRIEFLAENGSDGVVVLPFTREFAALSPHDFLEQTFGSCLPAQLHVGSDFRFGAKAFGSTADLEAWGKKVGCQVFVHGLTCVDQEPISSTRIRLLLAEGNIKQANALLGHPYFITAPVVTGRGEGAGLGFRTANLQLDKNLQTLGEGVYAAYVTCEGVRSKAAVSVGISPTYADSATSSCEAHLLDFEGDLYGKTLKIEFVAWLRPLKVFESTEALIKEVTANIAWVRENLSL